VDYAAGKPRLTAQSRGSQRRITSYTCVCLPDTVDPRGPKR
jgi:hypothetical protein